MTYRFPLKTLMLHTRQTALFTFTSASAHTVQNNALMAGKTICSSPRHHDSWVLHVLWHTALCYLVLHPPSHESFVQKKQHSALITAVSQCEHYCKLQIFATQRSTFFLLRLTTTCEHCLLNRCSRVNPRMVCMPSKNAMNNTIAKRKTPVNIDQLVSA